MTPRPLSLRLTRSSSRTAPSGRASLARRLVATGAALAAALVAAILVGAPPAAAGGPTSVLIVNYEGARAGAALTGSKAYDDLASALDVFNTPAGESRPANSFMSSQVRLTWMIHDVTPWRIDAIYLDGTTVWVSTAVSQDTGDLFGVPSVWHQPKDPELLVNTLTSLGVIGDAAASAAPRATSTPPAAAAERAAAGAPSASRSTAGYPWWTAILAAVAALGLGFVVGRGQGARTGRQVGARDPSVPAHDGMPPGPSGATAHIGAPTVPGGADEQARPAPVGFTPDEAPRRS